MRTEVIRIVFTDEDIDQLIDEIDENRGADGDPPLDRDKARANVEEWAKHIADTAMQHIDEALSSVISVGTP